MFGQNPVGFNRRGLVLFAHHDQRGLANLREPGRNIPIPDAVRVFDQGAGHAPRKGDAIQQVVFEQVTDLGPLAARPPRKTAPHELVAHLFVFGPQVSQQVGRVHKAGQICGAADNQIGGHEVRVVQAYLHGPHAAHGIANQNRAVYAQGGQHRGIVGGHVLNGVAAQRFARTPVAAGLNHDAAIAVGQQRDLVGPYPGVTGIAVQKNEWQTLPIIVILHPHPVFSLNEWHGRFSSLSFCRRPGCDRITC